MLRLFQTHTSLILSKTFQISYFFQYVKEHDNLSITKIKNDFFLTKFFFKFFTKKSTVGQDFFCLITYPYNARMPK